jgi:hypothetical protein
MGQVETVPIIMPPTGMTLKTPHKSLKFLNLKETISPTTSEGQQ